MRFRKLQIIPILFITGATILLFGLGIWQLQRMHWKTRIMAEIEHAQSMETLPYLPKKIDDSLLYREAILTGYFVHGRQFLLVGNMQDEGPGFFIVTPFVLEGDNRVILVNRGFSPEGKESHPEGRQTIRGILRPTRKKRLFMPANNVKKNVWFYEDLPQMSKIIYSKLLPYVLEATGEKQAGVYPIPSNGEVIMRNDHLHYAITWFSIGIIGLIMFILYHRVPETRKEELENPLNKEL